MSWVSKCFGAVARYQHWLSRQEAALAGATGDKPCDWASLDISQVCVDWVMECGVLSDDQDSSLANGMPFHTMFLDSLRPAVESASCLVADEFEKAARTLGRTQVRNLQNFQGFLPCKPSAYQMQQRVAREKFAERRAKLRRARVHDFNAMNSMPVHCC
jgi:hypothetical protein